jgi:hypothetical protein
VRLGRIFEYSKEEIDQISVFELEEKLLVAMEMD